MAKSFGRETKKKQVRMEVMKTCPSNNMVHEKRNGNGPKLKKNRKRKRKSNLAGTRLGIRAEAKASRHPKNPKEGIIESRERNRMGAITLYLSCKSQSIPALRDNTPKPKS
ncbi:hypothetical protein VNO77_40352 [Canavalia gladiata]|uniref:Uncharacterized protein n=1 Tax=Canavalia gladiata TaxID=3824 RepID=A0AAN9JXV6_CANGL